MHIHFRYVHTNANYIKFKRYQTENLPLHHSSHDDSNASTPFPKFCRVHVFTFHCCKSSIRRMEIVQAYYIKWRTYHPGDKQD